MGIGMKVPVTQGSVLDRDGLSFGGNYHFPATDTQPEQVIITVWVSTDDTSAEKKFKLSVGEAMEYSGQTWRLDEIDNRGWKWSATLTRVS